MTPDHAYEADVWKWELLRLRKESRWEEAHGTHGSIAALRRRIAYATWKVRELSQERAEAA